MYLSIGNDMAVRDTSIIGIFDLDNTTYSKKTVAFLNQAEKEGMVIPCDDLPKSFVLTAEYGLSKVHLTSLNSYTLEKRLKQKEPRTNGSGFFTSFIRKRWGHRRERQCKSDQHLRTGDCRLPGCTGRVLHRIHGATGWE